MKIKVSDLRDFFKKSAKIKSNGIIPIYDFLLFEFTCEAVSITKTNGNAFCKYTVTQDTETKGQLLIEEKRLSALVNNAKGEFVHFKVKGKKITLKDDNNELSLQLNEEISAFQTMPESEGAEMVILTPDVLSALFEARNFASLVESNFHYVYAHKKGNEHCVFASNRTILYVRKFEDELPNLALSPEVCSIIASFGHVQYYSAGNYDFFDTGNTVYGFIKTTYTAPEYAPVINSIDTTQTLVLDKNEVLSFCELVNSLAVKELPIIGFEASQDAGLLVFYKEPEYSVETEKLLPVERNFWPEDFSMNASMLKDVLKCFTSEKIVIATSGKQNIFGISAPEEKALTIAIAPVMHTPKN